jgi:hypothetical protein
MATFRKLNDLIDKGSHLVVEASREARPRPRLADLMKRACGAVDSGASDFASNPRHLANFGRNAHQEDG